MDVIGRSEAVSFALKIFLLMYVVQCALEKRGTIIKGLKMFENVVILGGPTTFTIHLLPPLVLAHLASLNTKH